jgi:hypothetical protein
LEETIVETAPSQFWEWLNALSRGEGLIVIVVGMFVLVMAIIFICGTVYKMHKNRLEDALKRELLERGMSADEIATVIGAKPSRTGARGLRP